MLLCPSRYIGPQPTFMMGLVSDAETTSQSPAVDCMQNVSTPASSTRTATKPRAGGGWGVPVAPVVLGGARSPPLEAVLACNIKAGAFYPGSSGSQSLGTMLVSTGSRPSRHSRHTFGRNYCGSPTRLGKVGSGSGSPHKTPVKPRAHEHCEDEGKEVDGQLGGGESAGDSYSLAEYFRQQQNKRSAPGSPGESASKPRTAPLSSTRSLPSFHNNGAWTPPTPDGGEDARARWFRNAGWSSYYDEAKAHLEPREPVVPLPPVPPAAPPTPPEPISPRDSADEDTRESEFDFIPRDGDESRGIGGQEGVFLV